VLRSSRRGLLHGFASELHQFQAILEAHDTRSTQCGVFTFHFASFCIFAFERDWNIEKRDSKNYKNYKKFKKARSNMMIKHSAADILYLSHEEK